MRLPYEARMGQCMTPDTNAHSKPRITAAMHEAAMAQAARRTAQDPVGELTPAASGHNPSQHL
ncbi:hypothetical protein B0G69_0615 [Paraburkholderia sp. RAU2J]|nr:hypothetical protein B0G69_0615 [Paraburkholderia sp. RAU2J]